MTELSFEAALNDRVGDMLDACTRCGKCVEVCPSARPADITSASPASVIAGVIDILRTGDGPEVSRRWATSCTLSGACIEACDYGVNPRFLLAMARVAIRKNDFEPVERRRDGVTKFRDTSRDVTVLSRLQLESDALARLGQGAASTSTPDEAPDFVFYTGCNVLKTPHIALLALDIMDTLDISYQVMGGPESLLRGHAAARRRRRDVRAHGREFDREDVAQQVGPSALRGVQAAMSSSPRPHCRPSSGNARSRPFEMTPFIPFLRTRLDELKGYLRERVELRVALHKHRGIPRVVQAAVEILQAIPGVELVDLGQPTVGLQSVNLAVLPAYKRELQRAELEAAVRRRRRRADHRSTTPIIANYVHTSATGRSASSIFWKLSARAWVFTGMIATRSSRSPRMPILSSANASDLIAEHALDPVMAREIIAKALLGDQPLPLKDGPRSTDLRRA